MIARIPSAIAVLASLLILSGQILSIKRFDDSIVAFAYRSAFTLLPSSFTEREEEYVAPEDDPTKVPLSSLPRSGSGEVHFIVGRDMAGGPEIQVPVNVDLACFFVPDIGSKACFELNFRHNQRSCVFSMRDNEKLPERPIVASYGSIGVKAARLSKGRRADYQLTDRDHLQVLACAREPRGFLEEEYVTIKEQHGQVMATVGVIGMIVILITIPITILCMAALAFWSGWKWFAKLRRHFR